jgi:hypothetical protein
MRFPFRLLTVALAAACGGGQKPPAADTTAAAPPAPAPIAVADLAGKWTINTYPDGRDTTITSELVATATTEGWTLAVGGQPPSPVRLRVDADSMMAEVGPFPSVLRKGLQVTTNSVWRLQGAKLVGTMVARYSGASVGADSVLTGRQEGTRVP